MAIKDFQCPRHSPESIIGATMAGPVEKNFKVKVLRRLENADLRLVSANKVLHKITVLLMFC